MKIAIVCSLNLSGKGGMETVISTVAKELTSHGVTVKLILRNGNGYKGWLNEIDHSLIQIESKGLISEVSFLYKLLRKLSSFKPDIVLAANPAAILYLRTIKYLSFNKRPIGSWIHFSLEDLPRRKMVKFADFHFAISSGIAEQIRNITHLPDKIHLVYNPINSKNQVIPRSTIPTFVYIGRLMPYGQKRVMDFISALGKLTGEWKAIIIGSGDISDLKAKALQLEISKNITWAGWHNNPWDIIESASSLVLTSESEGFGMVLVEALIRGVPCVSSDCPVGPRDIVKDGENGRLYPVGDVDRLSEILQNIIDNKSNYLPNTQKLIESVSQFRTETVVHNMYNILNLYKR